MAEAVTSGDDMRTFEIRQLGVVPYRIYARRGAPGLPQGRIGLDALLATPRWIELGRGATENRCSRWMRSCIPPDHVRLRVDAFSSMVALLRSGCGIGVLPAYVGAGEPELIAVSDDIDELTNPAWLLTHPELRRTARIQVFMRFVGDAVAGRLREVSESGLLAA